MKTTKKILILISITAIVLYVIGCCLGFYNQVRADNLERALKQNGYTVIDNVPKSVMLSQTQCTREITYPNEQTFLFNPNIAGNQTTIYRLGNTFYFPMLKWNNNALMELTLLKYTPQRKTE